MTVVIVVFRWRVVAVTAGFPAIFSITYIFAPTFPLKNRADEKRPATTPLKISNRKVIHPSCSLPHLFGVWCRSLLIIAFPCLPQSLTNLYSPPKSPTPRNTSSPIILSASSSPDIPRIARLCAQTTLATPDVLKSIRFASQSLMTVLNLSASTTGPASRPTSQGLLAKRLKPKLRQNLRLTPSHILPAHPHRRPEFAPNH